MSLKTIIQREAYQFREEGFQLSAGGRSQHYFDLRNLTLNPAYMREIVDNFMAFFAHSDLTIGTRFFGGLTMGADPIIYAICLSTDWAKSMYPLIVRKEAKAHGTGKLVEGIILDELKSQKCVVIDDVCTTGNSTLKAVAAIRDLGIKITDAICILDREEGGKENLSSVDVTLHSLYVKSDFGIGA